MIPEKVVTADPRIDDRWRRLARGAGGSLFTSPAWISAVCGTYGFQPECRVALDGAGEPVAGWAWVPVCDIRGERISSLPFCDRADPIVADKATWGALADGVVADAPVLTLRCLAPAVPISDPRFELVGEAAWHGTPLDGSVPEVRARLSGTARRNVAVADNNGVRVEPSTELDSMRRFHRLHVALRKSKYRLLAQPMELFERIWHEFSSDDAVVTLFAYVDGEPAAGAVFLEWNDVLYYKFGASLSEHLRLRPNDALFWAAIRMGIERGLRWVDWGLSDLDQPGLVAYKRKWASEERRIVTLRTKGTTASVHGEVNEMLGRLTQLLTAPRVPDEVSAEAGALLYRYFC